MRVIQIMPTVSFGDAVGNDARAICRVIGEMGYDSAIYAENIDSRLSDKNIQKIRYLPSLNKEDIVIFNHSTGTDLCYRLPELGGRKMMIYHNITPPYFFEGYSDVSCKLTEYGYEGTRYLSDKIEYVLADSRYNADDLVDMGYKCPIDIRPILIPFEDYKKSPSSVVMEKFSGDGYVNIVFVGRIAPNKKHEDIIAAFAYYKKHINYKSRLILVGSWSGMETYKNCLDRYVGALMLEDVIFTGHISFASILAYYQIADIFLCMSEHEGFCVPLIEAMFFEKPIIAFDSSAVPGTLGGTGILLQEKDPVFTASVIDRLANDRQLYDGIVEEQSRRLEDFTYDKVKDVFVSCLSRFINQAI